MACLPGLSHPLHLCHASSRLPDRHGLVLQRRGRQSTKRRPTWCCKASPHPPFHVPVFRDASATARNRKAHATATAAATPSPTAQGISAHQRIASYRLPRCDAVIAIGPSPPVKYREDEPRVGGRLNLKRSGARRGNRCPPSNAPSGATRTADVCEL